MDVVFSVLTMIGACLQNIAIHLPMAVAFLSESAVSFTRIGAFLNQSQKLLEENKTPAREAAQGLTRETTRHRRRRDATLGHRARAALTEVRDPLLEALLLADDVDEEASTTVLLGSYNNSSDTGAGHLQ